MRLPVIHEPLLKRSIFVRVAIMLLSFLMGEGSA